MTLSTDLSSLLERANQVPQRSATSQVPIPQAPKPEATIEAKTLTEKAQHLFRELGTSMANVASSTITFSALTLAPTLVIGAVTHTPVGSNLADLVTATATGAILDEIVARLSSRKERVPLLASLGSIYHVTMLPTHGVARLATAAATVVSVFKTAKAVHGLLNDKLTKAARNPV